MRRCHAYLVPGFFGFTALGAFSYFARVAETSRTLLPGRHGLGATVVSCRTKPPASVVWRAEGLREEIVQTGGLAAEELHFVGHSLGGVDVRLLLAPGAKLAVN